MQVDRSGLEQFNKDTRYFGAHWDELVERYPEQWVAVYQARVVGSAHDLHELLTDLKRRGIPIEHTPVEYVTPNEPLLIVPS